MYTRAVRKTDGRLSGRTRRLRQYSCKAVYHENAWGSESYRADGALDGEFVQPFGMGVTLSCVTDVHTINSEGANRRNDDRPDRRTY